MEDVKANPNILLVDKAVAGWIEKDKSELEKQQTKERQDKDLIIMTI